MKRSAGLVAFVALIGCSAIDPAIGDPNASIKTARVEAGPPVNFGRDIRPLMNRANDDPMAHGCKFCHYSTEPQHIGLDIAKLDMSTLGNLRKGGKNTGANIVVPGNPDGSAIIQKLRGTFSRGVRMPYSGPPYWSDAEIALVARWISEGAKGDDSE